MSNSKMINYTKISPNRTSPRQSDIDTITIHCMAGDCSVETCGDIFASEARQASSNYGVDSKGRIGLYVSEADRSWCSSSRANDHRAITIEVANDGKADTGWHVSGKAMAALINLCVDICKRNDIKELKWKNDKSLIGQVDKQNMTVHRWFAATDCPGEYLMSKMRYIANEVNTKLQAQKEQQAQAATPFMVRVKITNLQIRTGAGLNYAAKGNCPVGSYTITQVKTADGYEWGKLKSGAGWIALKYTERV